MRELVEGGKREVVRVLVEGGRREQEVVVLLSKSDTSCVRSTAKLWRPWPN